MIKSNYFKKIIFIFIFFHYSYVIYANIKLFSIDTFAKTVALGNTFVGRSDDIVSIHYNPGSLCFAKRNQFLINHCNYIENVKGDSIGFSTKYTKTAFGIIVNYIYFISPRIDGYGFQIGNFVVSNLFVETTYSHLIFKNVGIGINFKYGKLKYEYYISSLYACDIGILYRGKINIGFSVDNIGLPLKFLNCIEYLPIVLKLGISKRISFWHLILSTDIKLKLNYSKNFTVSSGIEYWINKFLWLRGGFELNPSSYSIGGGINLSFLDIKNIEIDYGTKFLENLNMIYSLSVGFIF